MRRGLSRVRAGTHGKRGETGVRASVVGQAGGLLGVLRWLTLGQKPT